MNLEKKMSPSKLRGRCKARTKNGKPCRAAATGGGLCFFHANPNKASELGRIGGKKNRHAAGNNDSLPPLGTAIAVRDTLSRLIGDIHSGRVPPRVGAALAPLLNLQLRAIEASDLEGQIAKFEKLAESVPRLVEETEVIPDVSLDGLLQVDDESED